MRGFTLPLAAVLVAGTVLSSAGAASAGTHVKPMITASQATFVIPASPAGIWQMTLTTFPPPEQHLGETPRETSGTLTLPVPQTPACAIQADVRVSIGGGPFVFYSGDKMVVPGCGQSGTGQRFTPGYWKTHQDATTALLPQSLGGYTVSTFAQASAIFDAMKCSDAVNCLAGHLLAAELDVANGSSICITGVIFQANKLLTKVGYAGPGSYPVSASQRADAIGFEQALNNYTNDSTSTSC